MKTSDQTRFSATHRALLQGCRLPLVWPPNGRFFRLGGGDDPDCVSDAVLSNPPDTRHWGAF